MTTGNQIDRGYDYRSLLPMDAELWEWRLEWQWHGWKRCLWWALQLDFRLQGFGLVFFGFGFAVVKRLKSDWMFRLAMRHGGKDNAGDTGGVPRAAGGAAGGAVGGEGEGSIPFGGGGRRGLREEEGNHWRDYGEPVG